jgi:hypothetical protein
MQFPDREQTSIGAVQLVGTNLNLNDLQQRRERRSIKTATFPCFSFKLPTHRLPLGKTLALVEGCGQEPCYGTLAVGVMAIPVPNVFPIAPKLVAVAMSRTKTCPSTPVVTYACFPLGAMAIAKG